MVKEETARIGNGGSGRVAEGSARVAEISHFRHRWTQLFLHVDLETYLVESITRYYDVSVRVGVRARVRVGDRNRDRDRVRGRDYFRRLHTPFSIVGFAR